MKKITLCVVAILAVTVLQAQAVPKTPVIKGFNQNFAMMPNMTEELYKNIQLLQPQMLRYPGGEVTHSWDWRKGIIKTRATNSVHKINEIKTLVDKTGAKFTFVLDIINSTVEDQIEMLKSIEQLGVSIEYIELGNETYAQKKDALKAFPTGKEYADRVNQWVITLRQNFPKAKIGAVLLARRVKPGNKRMYQWNRLVVDATFKNVDAYIYHIYIPENATVEQTENNFIAVSSAAKTGNKEIWITEYGNKNKNTTANYYSSLNKLADFVESYPNVTIALNHQIVGGTKSKLSDDGKEFNAEGKLFLERLKKKAAKK